MLCGVAVCHALTRVSVARARAAGFEMLWAVPDALLRVTRMQEMVVMAELRNRDSLPTRFRELSVAHAPTLAVSITPQSGEVPGRGRLLLELRVRPLRVGFHGIFSLTLHTIRAPGLFTVPLAFSNPLVFEVLPKVLRAHRTGAWGGRAQNPAPLGKSGRRLGDGAELRELREHRPGDPYKRIAWKASARRGRLLIIEKEQEETDNVWVFIDASVDSASGPLGHSALDRAIDEAVATIDAHLARGDAVGLAVVGARVLAEIPPGRGPRHAAELVSALTLQTHTADADRSDWDDGDVAERVLEHATSLDASTAKLRPYEREKLHEHARRLLARAPAQAASPWAPTAAEQLLRKYLLSFGVQPPPRTTSDRHRTELQLAEQLRKVHTKRPPPTLIYLFGAPPSFETPKQYLQLLSSVKKRRTELRFVPMTDELLPSVDASAREKIAFDALGHRQKLATEQGLAQLGRLGVVVGTQARKRRRLPGVDP